MRGLPVHHDRAANIFGDDVVGGPGRRALLDEGHLCRDAQQPVQHRALEVLQTADPQKATIPRISHDAARTPYVSRPTKYKYTPRLGGVVQRITPARQRA